MVSCAVPTPTIPKFLKYKLYKYIPHGLPASPVIVVHELSIADIADKPVETDIQPESFLSTTEDNLALTLEALVDSSATNANDVTQGVDMYTVHMFRIPWIHKLIPELERLAAEYHIGNYVMIRATGERVFESMPIYARIGMHLLFHGKGQILLLGTETVANFLKRLSIKQGKIYDSPQSVASIPSFVKTYSLSLKELLEPDIKKYGCFNDFFSRKLKPDARPVQNAQDPLGICSAADCRLVVYQTFDVAREFWVKGRNFTVPELLDVPPTSDTAITFDGSSIAVFRLAPQDYHRFHCPIDGMIDGEPVNIPGQYYTVNPQAVNQPSFDVFTANVRSIIYMTHEPTGKKVAFIAVGALLVGSVIWTYGGDVGDKKTVAVKRGEELGCFKYGGSTIVALFERGLLEFDADLIKNSEEALETLVKVGDSVGTSVKESCAR
ncbi:phosphatidylserine decarboxylase-domain-containing protein [Desarmillaria ectypa]|nr:phosphatidylserine decarboxylase-domain-containing protein [Desarmillaria ectypa]